MCYIDSKEQWINSWIICWNKLLSVSIGCTVLVLSIQNSVWTSCNQCEYASAWLIFNTYSIFSDLILFISISCFHSVITSVKFDVLYLVMHFMRVHLPLYIHGLSLVSALYFCAGFLLCRLASSHNQNFKFK